MQDQAGAQGRLASPVVAASSASRSGRELDGPVGPAPDPGTAGPRDGDREARVSQEREERRVRLRDDDLDRRSLAAAHLADDPGRAAERADPGGRACPAARRRDPLGEGCDNLVGPERRAVVQLHVLAEPERPHEPVARHGPRRRERGLDVAAIAECDQALVEEANREELGRIARVRRVEGRREARHADVELARRRAAAPRASASSATSPTRHVEATRPRNQPRRRGTLGRIASIIETSVARRSVSLGRRSDREWARRGTAVAPFSGREGGAVATARQNGRAKTPPQLDFFFQRRL